MEPKEIPIGEARYHPCKKCGRVTKQTVQLYNLNDPNGGKVWHCGGCKENVEWCERGRI